MCGACTVLVGGKPVSVRHTVPVTFTPKLSLYVGASGELKVGITTSLNLHTELVTGVEWRRGTWKLISDFKKETKFVEPELVDIGGGHMVACHNYQQVGELRDLERTALREKHETDVLMRLAAQLVPDSAMIGASAALARIRGDGSLIAVRKAA